MGRPDPPGSGRAEIPAKAADPPGGSRVDPDPAAQPTRQEESGSARTRSSPPNIREESGSTQTRPAQPSGIRVGPGTASPADLPGGIRVDPDTASPSDPPGGIRAARTRQLQPTRQRESGSTRTWRPQPPARRNPGRPEPVSPFDSPGGILVGTAPAAQPFIRGPPTRDGAACEISALRRSVMARQMGPLAATGGQNRHPCEDAKSAVCPLFRTLYLNVGGFVGNPSTSARAPSGSLSRLTIRRI